MEVEVYVDVVFFINFIMDFFIFFIVSKLAKRKVIYKRIILGSAVASILYCLIMFIPVLQIIYNFFGALVILMLAIMVTFKPKNLKEFIKLLVLSHISAFSMAGASMALFYYIDLPKFINDMISFNIQNFPFKILLITTASAYILIKLSLGWIKNIFTKNKTFYNMKIFFNNKEIDLNALVDTGNSLCDPITSEPVIVAEFSVIKNFLPDEIKLIFYEGKENDLSMIVNNIGCSDISKRIRLIPFSSLGVKNGMLMGFKPDEVEIQNNDDIMKLKNVIIGIYNYHLSKDGTYQALINPQIFENTL